MGDITEFVLRVAAFVVIMSAATAGYGYLAYVASH